MNLFCPSKLRTSMKGRPRNTERSGPTSKKRGKPVGSMDMLIGAHALSLGVTLVTNNVREFRQIKSLKVVDWSV